MTISKNYLAVKINALKEYLHSTDHIGCRSHHVHNHIYKSYYFTDRTTGKRHEHISTSSAGKALEQTFLRRGIVSAHLEHFQALWDTLSDAPVPALDLHAMRRISRSIITKEFYDSLLPCQNTKPITRPNPYKGIVFRSKSEREIAEILDELGIEYKYEPSIPVNNYEIYGDFVCFIRELGFGFIIEHCGMMDTPAYVDKTIRTFRDYNSLGFLPGFNILYTYERNDCPPPLNYFLAQISALLDTFCAP